MRWVMFKFLLRLLSYAGPQTATSFRWIPQGTGSLSRQAVAATRNGKYRLEGFARYEASTGEPVWGSALEVLDGYMYALLRKESADKLFKKRTSENQR